MTSLLTTSPRIGHFDNEAGRSDMPLACAGKRRRIVDQGRLVQVASAHQVLKNPTFFDALCQAALREDEDDKGRHSPQTVQQEKAHDLNQRSGFFAAHRSDAPQ